MAALANYQIGYFDTVWHSLETERYAMGPRDVYGPSFREQYISRGTGITGTSEAGNNNM
jgi:hypothetical protein